MNLKLKEKVYEALTAVLPITVIVIVLSVFLLPIEVGTISVFFCGALIQ